MTTIRMASGTEIEVSPGLDYPGFCVAFFCHDGAGNMLWQRRSQKCRNERGKWDVGSGGVEFGERAHEAVRRELLEEYGAEPIEIHRLGIRESIFSDSSGVHHWVATDWLVRVDRNQVRICEPEMVDAIEWRPIGHPPSPLHVAVPDALRDYRQMLMALAHPGPVWNALMKAYDPADEGPR